MENKRIMLKKSHIDRKLVELYKNSSFVSERLFAPSASSVKFSADGQKTIDGVKRSESDHRHLEPMLELPDLDERCRIADDDELYELSKQLADNDNETQAEPLNEAVNLDDKTWTNYTQFYGKDAKPSQTSYASDKKTSVSDNMASQVQANEEQILQNNKDNIVNGPLEPNVEKNKKKLEFELHSSEESEIDFLLTEESCRESAQKNQPTMTLEAQIVLTAIQEQRTSIMDIAKTEAHAEIMKTSKELNPFPSVMFKPVKLLLSFIKLIAKKIDDYYLLTLLLHLGVVIYLLYILFFDVNIYINEERRYLEKMRSAGVLLKWFYYVMHLLSVRMF